MMTQSSLQEIEEAFDLTFMNFSELIAACELWEFFQRLHIS